MKTTLIHNRIKSLIFISCALILFGCASVASQPEPSKGLRLIPVPFASIVPILQKQTPLPLVLPTWIPTEALVPGTNPPQPYLDVPLTKEGKFRGIYPYPLTMTSSGYEISLDAEPECRGAGACSFGLMSGQKLTPETPSVAEEYAYQTEDPNYNPVGRSPEKAGPVSLAKGIKGYFIPFVCGANCDTSKVFWEQNGTRYMVGIRYATKKSMVEMANSAIENQH